jgi:hypothetical protein
MNRDPNIPIGVWPAAVGLASIGAAFIGYFVAALSIRVSSCPVEALCFVNGTAGLIGAAVAGVVACFLSMKVCGVQSPIATLVVSTVIGVVIFEPVMSIAYPSRTPATIKFLVMVCIFAVVVWLCNYLVRRVALMAHRGRA